MEKWEIEEILVFSYVVGYSGKVDGKKLFCLVKK